MSLTKIAIAALGMTMLGSSAGATTFPSVTTIYVASGAMDSNTDPDAGISTLINCTNLSGQTASVRYQFRRLNGAPNAGATLLLANLGTHTVTTEGNVGVFDEDAILPTGTFFGGSLQILSTQSAIFCSAMLIRAEGSASTEPDAAVALHMVRFNPHPGTVE